MKKCIHTAILVLLACLLGAGCGGAAGTSESPGASSGAPIVLSTAVPQADTAALANFFTRWSAYTDALASGASERADVYRDVANIGDDWENSTYYLDDNRTAQVILALPTGNGSLLVVSQGGTLLGGQVRYDSNDTDVAASLSYIICCNAFVYSLGWEGTAAEVQSVYNECLNPLRQQSGDMMRGDELEYYGYRYQMSLNPETQEMTFEATKI